jgi:large subunit ribosomal protein L31e
MAEQKTTKIEREYVIPLRRFWSNVPEYRRAARAVKAIKQFVAKHMKVQDRDLDKVKVDTYLNSEIWSRSAGKPPAKIKVKVVKEGDIVTVELAEIPEHHKFHKLKAEKRHKISEKKTETPVQEAKPEAKEGTQTEEQKKDEQEKETSTAILHEKEAKQDLKAQKNIGKVDKNKTHPQRMALKK